MSSAYVCFCVLETGSGLRRVGVSLCVRTNLLWSLVTASRFCSFPKLVLEWLTNTINKTNQLIKKLRWLQKAGMGVAAQSVHGCAPKPAVRFQFSLSLSLSLSSFHFSSVYMHVRAVFCVSVCVCVCVCVVYTPLTSYLIHISYVSNMFGFLFFFYIFCSSCMCRIALVPHGRGLDVKRPWI